MGTRRDEPTVVLLTPEQAAEALGIGRWKLYDLLRQGRLRSLRIGSCRRSRPPRWPSSSPSSSTSSAASPDGGRRVTRARGEGSVYRKGDRWEAAAYVHGRRRSVRAATKAEAHARLRELQRRAAAGEPITDTRLTVAEYLEYWLSVVESTVRARTHQRYAAYVRVHAIPEIGHVKLAELRPITCSTSTRSGSRRDRRRRRSTTCTPVCIARSPWPSDGSR